MANGQRSLGQPAWPPCLTLSLEGSFPSCLLNLWAQMLVLQAEGISCFLHQELSPAGQAVSEQDQVAAPGLGVLRGG